MNPRTFTTLTLVTLIAGALLSLGIRHAIDLRREATATATVSPSGRDPSSLPKERRPPSREGSEQGNSARRDVLFQRLRVALSTANEMERSRALLALIDELEPSEFPLIMEGIEQQRMSPNGYNRAAAEMLSAWAAVDPGPAVLWEIGWADKRGLGDNTGNPTIALTSWLRRDSKAVEQWWLDHAMETAHSGLLTFVKSELASSETKVRAESLAGGDLTEAIAAIRQMPEKERSQLTSRITEEVLQRGPEAVRQWLDLVDDPALRGEVLARVVSRDRSLPAAYRVELYWQHPELAKAVSPGTLYGAYARENEEAALTGFDELPDGPDKLSATRSLINALSDDPALPETVVKIMDRYPEVVTDSVIARWMEGANNAGERSVYLAQLPRIRSEELRDQKRREILNQWLRQDAAAAREWMGRNEIPASLRQELEDR